MIKPLAEGRLGILCVCMCVCYLHNYFVWDRSAREKSIGAGQRPPKPKAKLLTLAYDVSPVLAQPHVHIHFASSFPIYKALTTLAQSLYIPCSSALKVPVMLATLSFTREGCLHQDCRALPTCQEGTLEIPLASCSVRAAWRPHLRALPPSWLSSKNHKKSDQRVSWTTDEQVVPHTDPQLAAAQTPWESLAEWVAGWVGL